MVEAQRVPPPLAVERLLGEMRPAPDSGTSGESQEAGLELATRRFGPRRREEVRNPTLRELDVAPPPAAEAELYARRLTGHLSGGAKWEPGAGRLGKCSLEAQQWPPSIEGEGEFF